jgi:hypothetical protein
MPYQWDRVPSYRLQYAIVNQFLMELFGNYDFYTQVNSATTTLGLLYSNTLRKYRKTLILTIGITPAFQRPHSILDPQGFDRCKTSHTLSICKLTDILCTVREGDVDGSEDVKDLARCKNAQVNKYL